MKALVPAAGILSCLLMADPGVAMAQTSRLLDEGTLIIMINNSVIGNERFELRAGRGNDTAGFTVRSTASYPPDAPMDRLAAVVEFDTDSLPTGAQFDLGGVEQRRTLIDIGARRITIRIVSPTGEEWGEHRRRAPVLFLIDSIFAQYIMPPRTSSATFHGITSAGRVYRRVTVRDGGLVRTRVGTTQRALRLVTIAGEPNELLLYYDERGRLIKLEVPGRALLVVRAAALRR